MAKFSISIKDNKKTGTYTDNYGKSYTTPEFKISISDGEVSEYIARLITEDNRIIEYSYGEKYTADIADENKKKISDFYTAYQEYTISLNKSDTGNSDTLKFFQDDSIMQEQAYGLNISQDGTWNTEALSDPKEFMKAFSAYEQSISVFGKIVSGNVTVEEGQYMITAITDNSISSFDSTGTIIVPKFKCPQCGKVIDQILKNGYCSKKCAEIARIQRNKAKLSAAGENTLKIINDIKTSLKILDIALNIISGLPEMIKGKAVLPQEYRDYVTLRIDAIFIQLKIYTNNIMIKKNTALIELMKKLKFGTLDSNLQSIFKPIQSILTSVQAVQTVLNTTMKTIINLLKTPASGLSPQSYGWLMTAKSAMVPEHTGKLIIEITPNENIIYPKGLRNRMNNINTKAIEAITNAALPPIKEYEYFIDPTAFKLRYALSQDNTKRLRKMNQILESLVVFGADTFPRYKRLNLKNIWFVLSIFTGWGPMSRTVFGDFIIHAVS